MVIRSRWNYAEVEAEKGELVTDRWKKKDLREV
jgi:hypothetical protein